ncbi:hypothetical protein Aph01nite_59420 [Acrocarpospora phusangensis]|uniref:HNH nuclease domain-containing protein n=2 Tax=Acrocarpospora phusangensis TaxID=1070424 RepID=A0A919UR50_9ACTN|nr:hypothetical protein Aph01nite_59420 [Acrocarpospora phusangensis]
MQDNITLIKTGDDQIEFVKQRFAASSTVTASEKIIDRFASRVDVLGTGCWAWTHERNDPKYGGLPYGRFFFEGKLWVAHRWIYEQLHGPVPQGLVLDHFLVPSGRCIGALCVNPGHLQPVTQRENTLRGSGPTAINSAKTHCPEGHDFDAVNSQGRRVCTICLKAYKREYNHLRAAQKQAA